MNYLTIAQLASTAFQVIGKASHPQFNHDAVSDVKAGLEQLFKFCQEQNTQQQKKPAEIVKEEVKDAD